MRLKSLLFALLTLLPSALSAQLTAEKALLSMPGRLLAPVSAAELTREMSSRLNRLSDTGIELKADSGYTLQLHLLPARKDTVIAVIETIDTPIPDSRLTLYSRSWSPLPALWTEPQASDWLTPAGRKDRAAAVESAPFILAEYLFDATAGILTLKNRTENQSYLIPELKYRWTPRGFRKI